MFFYSFFIFKQTKQIRTRIASSLCSAQISMLAQSSGRWLYRWDSTRRGLSCRRDLCFLPTLSSSKATWACALPRQLLWLLIVRHFAHTHSSHRQLWIQSVKLCESLIMAVNATHTRSQDGGLASFYTRYLHIHSVPLMLIQTLILHEVNEFLLPVRILSPFMFSRGYKVCICVDVCIML